MRTLRWRLTLSYVAMLVVLLTALGSFHYVTLRASLIASRVDTLTGDVEAAKTLFSRTASVRTLGLPAAADRFATMVSTVSGRTVSVIVFDQNGKEIAASAAPAQVPRLDAATLRANGPAQEVPGAAATSYLVTSFPETAAGKLWVEVATPMDPIQTVLRRTTALLVAGGTVAVLLALGLGLWLTARGLRPLNRLTATAGELAGGDLAARSRLAHGDDEIGALGKAFDNMAERIESAFRVRSESEAQMRRFIADASHELRTPVTSLKGYIDVMRRGAGRDPQSLDAILLSMQREADRMRGLVLDLLTLARLDAQRPVLAEEVDVNAIVAAVLDEGVANMPPTLHRELTVGRVIAMADTKALTSILRNLLINACKYAPGAAQTWSTSLDQGAVSICVEDAGPGIPVADLPHIFERFYRGEKTRGREEGGSGLGLSIVQSLARSMGGDASVASREGAGTTVTIRLPAPPG